MKQQINFKSILIGFLGAALLFIAFSFKDDGSDPIGRYQTSIGEGGVIILDTKTGSYIFDPYFNNKNWKKGNFTDTHRLGK